MAEPGRQSNTSTLLLGHARDEIVAATGYTPEAVENTICNGLEERRLGFTHGHIEGQLPPEVTDIAFHLFSRRTTDEKLEYDFANSSITRSGSGYSYAVRNIRVERIELMTWCRKDNLLLPEELLAPPFNPSPEFARPALTQRHVLQAESFSVGALDFATPVLTVREVPKPPETPESMQEPAGQLEPMAANPTKPAPASPAAAVTAEVAALDVKLSNPESWPQGLRKLIELMKTYSPPPSWTQSRPVVRKKAGPKEGQGANAEVVLESDASSNTDTQGRRVLPAGKASQNSFPREISRGKREVVKSLASSFRY